DEPRRQVVHARRVEPQSRPVHDRPLGDGGGELGAGRAHRKPNGSKVLRHVHRSYTIFAIGCVSRARASSGPTRPAPGITCSGPTSSWRGAGGRARWAGGGGGPTRSGSRSTASP